MGPPLSTPCRCPSRRRMQHLFCGLIVCVFLSVASAFTNLNSFQRYRHPRISHTAIPLSSSDHKQHALLPVEYLATCIPGLAPVLEEELISLGAASTTVLSNAAVSFTSETKPEKSKYPIALSALLWVRTAHRILEKIETFQDLESREDVYDAVQRSRMHVKDLLGDGQGGLLSLSVKVIANGGRLPKDISHSHYTALTIKNALVDQVRDLRGDRPDVDIESADVPIVAIFHSQGPKADMTLYRSLSPPGSLHKRGYRAGEAIHKAAMKESLAAGLLLQAGWLEACQQVRGVFEKKTDDTSQLDGLTLVDPMCGSSTFLLEAAMMAVDFAPGLMRIMCNVPDSKVPPVLRWKGYKEEMVDVWKEMLLESSQRVKSGFAFIQQNEGAIQIIGNDIHGGALDLADESLTKAGDLNRLVTLHQNNCREWTVLIDDDKKTRHNQQVWVTTNPPWGVRLSDDDHESWESLRIFLRSNCPPGRTQAWVLSGNKSATKHLGLRRSQSLALKTGQQDLRWIQYVILDKKPRFDERRTTVVASKDRTIMKPKQPQANTKVTTDEAGRWIRNRNLVSAKGVTQTTRSPPRKLPVAGDTKNNDDSWI